MPSYATRVNISWIFCSLILLTVNIDLKFSRSDPESSRDIRFPQNKGRKRSERLPNETDPIRTNAYQTEVQVENYWLEYQFEKKKAHLPWDLRRVQLLESFIGPAAQFGVELESHLGQLPIFDYGSFTHAHTNDSCDQTKAREWVYVSLFQKAVQDANGVALLRSKSLGSQAITLWRSLFETDVLCQYIGARLSNDHLACRYPSSSMIRRFRRDSCLCKFSSRLSSRSYSGPLYLVFTGATGQRGSPVKGAARAYCGDMTTWSVAGGTSPRASLSMQTLWMTSPSLVPYTTLFFVSLVLCSVRVNFSIVFISSL